MSFFASQEKVILSGKHWPGGGGSSPLSVVILVYIYCAFVKLDVIYFRTQTIIMKVFFNVSERAR